MILHPQSAELMQILQQFDSTAVSVRLHFSLAL